MNHRAAPSPRPRLIREGDWPQILRLQAQAYADFIQESEAALRAKYLMGPEFCRVLEAGPHIQGYCLAHPWPRHQIPKLHDAQAKAVTADNLFLHDLAVAPTAAGRGYASRLFAAVREAAEAAGYGSISLVAVQNSATFWQRQGFQPGPDNEVTLPTAYGSNAVFMVCPLPQDGAG